MKSTARLVFDATVITILLIAAVIQIALGKYEVGLLALILVELKYMNFNKEYL